MADLGSLSFNLPLTQKKTMKISTIAKATLTMVVALWLPSASYADVCVASDPDFDPVLCAAGGSGSGAPGGAGGSAAVPVDGGASLLVAAGVAFAARKMKKSKTTPTDTVA